MEKLECFSKYIEKHKFASHSVLRIVFEVRVVFNLIIRSYNWHKCPSTEKWIQGTFYICEVEYHCMIEMQKVTWCIDQP